MDTDRRIHEAIAAGQRNKEVMELVRNWCRHARVQKFGGTGIVEAETGLPIGHHSMACQYAPAGGMATWDLAEAALNFYDRNCVGCAHRAPVGLPNLSELVGQRDAALAKRESERQAHEAEVAARRAARKERRSGLRASLALLAASIIDYVEEIDGPDPGDAPAKLLGTAKLAPETFDPRVIEYFFELLESGEHWFYDIGLSVLRQLGVDATHLTRCALLALAHSRSYAVAIEIVAEYPQLADEARIPAALPALIELAHPRSYPMLGQVISIPEPLINLYRSHPQAVERALEGLLDRREAYFVSVGARGVAFLAGTDPMLPLRVARSLIAKVVRSRLLIEHHVPSPFGDNGVLGDLREALALALQADPDRTDAMLAEFLASAPADDEVQIYKVYERILRGRRRQNHHIQADAADKIALRRLLSAATQTTSYDILQELHGAFTYVPEELIPLARAEVSTILGAALMLSEKIRSPEESPILEPNPVSRLERSNVQGQRINLQSALVDWAAEAAAGERRATSEYLEILSIIRDEHETLRAELTEQAYRLMRTSDGLTAALPAIYGALFGSAVRVRAAAAEAIGKLTSKTKDDLPSLVHEAIVAQLTDPFVIVHQAAFETLERTELPEQFESDARGAVLALIGSYYKSRTADRFLVDCICLYVDRYATEAEKSGGLIDVFLEILGKIKAHDIVDEHRRLSRQFGHKARFAEIWIQALEQVHAVSYREDDLIETLNTLPRQEIYRHRARLEKLGIDASSSWTMARRLIEALTRAGAWSEAAAIADTVYGRIPRSIEMHARKLDANRHRIAARFEAAIQAGRLDEIAELSQQWRRNEEEIEEDRVANERRRRPFQNIPGAH